MYDHINLFTFRYPNAKTKLEKLYSPYSERINERLPGEFSGQFCQLLLLPNCPTSYHKNRYKIHTGTFIKNALPILRIKDLNLCLVHNELITTRHIINGSHKTYRKNIVRKIQICSWWKIMMTTNPRWKGDKMRLNGEVEVQTIFIPWHV